HSYYICYWTLDLQTLFSLDEPTTHAIYTLSLHDALPILKSNEDRKWITALMLDDEQALKFIYDKYSLQVFNYSYLLLKDTGWSEGVVQEVFVNLWKNRSKLDPSGRLIPYLSVLAKRASLNKLRDIKSFTPSFDHLWNNISSVSDCPHEKLIAREFSDYLNQVLSRLPERQREVFKLSRFEGFTHQQIAEELKISPNTVKNHMIQ